MLLDDVLESLSGEVGPQLAEVGVPPHKAGDVLSLANSSLIDEFKNRASGEGLEDMLGLFNGTQQIQDNPLVDSLSGSFASQIANKLGISPEMARSAAALIIPALLSKLNDTTPDSGLSEDMLTDIMGGGGFMDKLKGLFN